MEVVVIALGVLLAAVIVLVFASNVWLELTRKKRRQKRIERSRARRDDTGSNG